MLVLWGEDPTTLTRCDTRDPLSDLGGKVPEAPKYPQNEGWTPRGVKNPKKPEKSGFWGVFWGVKIGGKKTRKNLIFWPFLTPVKRSFWGVLKRTPPP